MKPLVSVILPVYKVEQYLQECVDSVRNQTMQEIEIILVDDGSPDNCPQMCDRFAEEDSRIRVLHQKNGGVSVARNAGMEIAQGDWIMFVDSDDWIEPDAVEIVYRKAIETNCEIVVASNYHNYSDHEKDAGVGNPDIECVFEAEKYRKYLMGACFVTPHNSPRLFPEEMHFCTKLCTPWRKLYNADFLKSHKIQFPHGVAIGEDSIFNLYAFLNCQSVCVINKRIYHYRMRGSSAVGDMQNGWCKKILSQRQRLEEILREHNLELELQEFLHLRAVTDTIRLMQHSYQTADSWRNLIHRSQDLRAYVKNPLVGRAIKAVRLEDIKKYKLMFRLLKLRLYTTTILVYRYLYLRYPEKYGKKKFG